MNVLLSDRIEAGHSYRRCYTLSFCVSVCVSAMTVSCAQTAEPIELKFCTETRMFPGPIPLEFGVDTPKGGGTPPNVSIMDLQFLVIGPGALRDRTNSISLLF